MAEENHPFDPDVSFAFALDIDGIVCGRFRECSGIEWTIATESFQQGGENRHAVQLIGTGTFKPLVLKKGFFGYDTEIYDWIYDQMNPAAPTERKKLSVIAFSTDGEETMRYNFKGAFITRYKGPALNATSSEIAFEEVELAYDYFEFKPR